MARGRRRFVSRGGPGPNFSWARFVDQPATVAANTKVFLAILATGIDLDLTIRRNRGRFFVNSDQAAAAEGFQGAFGVMVVSLVAATVGAGSIPGPVTDTDANWMVWEPFQGRFQILGAGTGNDGDSGAHFDFDSKAMRKLSEDEALVMMVENSNAVSGFDFTLGVSTLVSLRGRS